MSHRSEGLPRSRLRDRNLELDLAGAPAGADVWGQRPHQLQRRPVLAGNPAVEGPDAAPAGQAAEAGPQEPSQAPVLPIVGDDDRHLRDIAAWLSDAAGDSDDFVTIERGDRLAVAVIHLHEAGQHLL